MPRVRGVWGNMMSRRQTELHASPLDLRYVIQEKSMRKWQMYSIPRHTVLYCHCTHCKYHMEHFWTYVEIDFNVGCEQSCEVKWGSVSFSRGADIFLPPCQLEGRDSGEEHAQITRGVARIFKRGCHTVSKWGKLSRLSSTQGRGTTGIWNSAKSINELHAENLGQIVMVQRFGSSHYLLVLLFLSFYHHAPFHFICAVKERMKWVRYIVCLLTPSTYYASQNVKPLSFAT